MFGFIKNEKTCFFALGVAAATAGVKFLKSKTFHNGCVKTVAKGMKIKDEAAAELLKIKEDAEDIRADEKETTQE
ncbi:MAG: DUF1490 domain-containing protein [Ruminococcus sp.]|nr:DUF1490 domain-containing protein [Ruminococcus sp.]